MEWEERLSNLGYRLTEPRRVVMRILSASAQPLAPLQIYERAKKMDAHLGLVSVYRAMELFTDLGLVRRMHLDDGCHAYIVSSPGHNHTVVCRNCDKAVEFIGDEDINELITRVEKITGFVIDDHLLQFYGLCKDCRKKS
jgi:Fur family ferric uptake transcriptional regulator